MSLPRSADYDTVASRYDRRYEGQEHEGIESALRSFLAGGQGLDVLEAGCGTGHWLPLLTTRAGRLAGIDPSAGMLERARQVEHGAWLVRARAEELPFATGSFDRVLCVNAFHHFAAKATFVREARRVLRSEGGMMILGLDPHTEFRSWWVYDYFDGALERDLARYPASREIRTAMAEAGFARCATREAQPIMKRVPAGTALERGLLDRSATSQLMILSEEEYQDGLERIRGASAAATAAGGDLVLATDLRLYATTGWVEP